MTSITERQLIKTLRHDEKLICLNDDDILFVTRGPRGNMLPGFSRAMTVREAINFGAWDSVQGSMDYRVVLHPDYYENAGSVFIKNKRAYAIEQKESD